MQYEATYSKESGTWFVHEIGYDFPYGGNKPVLRIYGVYTVDCEKLAKLTAELLNTHFAAMTPDNSKWQDFLLRLGESLEKYSCDATLSRHIAVTVMEDMGLRDLAVQASLGYFNLAGWLCDCEIMLKASQ